MTLRADLPKAFTATWLIVSTIAIGAVLLSFVVPAEVVHSLLPGCEAKARGSTCPACGLTTAFVLLSDGDVAAAREANTASPYLYYGFIANFFAAITYVFLTLLRRRTGDPPTCNSSP